MIRRRSGRGKARNRKAKKKGKAKRSVSRKTVQKGKKARREVQVGAVNHYFPHVKAAVFKVKRAIAVGDVVLFQGHTTSFKQKITSMQIDRQPIQKARPGQEIGLQVKKRVRIHDKVLLVR